MNSIDPDILDQVQALRDAGLDSDAMDLLLMHDDRVGDPGMYGGRTDAPDSDDDV